jgi:hypothetical protein
MWAAVSTRPRQDLVSTLHHDILPVARLKVYFQGVWRICVTGKNLEESTMRGDVISAFLPQHRSSHRSSRRGLVQARISSWTKNCGNREKSEENFDGPYLMAHALRALDAANRNRTTPLGDDTRAHYERPDTDAVHEAPSTGPLSPTSLRGRCRCRVDRHAENLKPSPVSHWPCGYRVKGAHDRTDAERILHRSLSH